MMALETTDVLVCGGGIAGLTAAAAFASAGFSVICVDPAPAGAADLRSTALLQPSVALLQDAGLWPELAPHAAPLQTMRIIDAGGADPAPRLVRAFSAAEISDQPFGWNLPNAVLRSTITAHLARLPGVSFRPGLAATLLFTRTGEARVTLSDQSRIAARLVIAADGRASPLRAALGIGVRTLRYGQKALAFSVAHPVAHENISTEIHRTGGPFTLVPLPDRDGTPASAVVWMERGPEAARLAALPVPAFEAEMTARSCAILGSLTLTSPRSLWPIITQIAERMAGERTALMAEAAHVLPPIGAQGLNMSLADLACLLDLARKAPDSLGTPAMLDAYHRARHPEIAARLLGIDALNRAAMQEAQGLRDLRALALSALYAVAPVRQALMRRGTGLR